MSKLRDALLKEDTVHMKVLNAARSLAASCVFVLEVTSEAHSGLQVLADGLNCDMLDKPFRFHRVDSCDAIIEFLEEVDSSG